MKCGSLICLVAILMVMIAVPAAASLLNNGNFETGNTSSWTFWKAGWSIGEQVSVQSTDKYEGSYALKLAFPSGYGSFGVYQQVAVVPGESYRISGYWKGTYSSGDNWFEVLLIDGAFSLAHADDPQICPDNFAAAYDPATSQFGWEPISAAYVTTPYIQDGVRTASGNVMTVVLKVGGFGRPSGYFDDMKLEVIPEPSSLVALSGGMMLLAGVIRRRR